MIRPTVVALACLVALLLSGCAPLQRVVGDHSFDRADDLGLLGMDSKLPQADDVIAGRGLPRMLPADIAYQRTTFAEAWMARSDLLCRQYKDRIIAASRDTRLGSGLASTLLSGLATIFTPAATVRALAGAATIVSAGGAITQSDAFEQQAGDVIATAIQTARQNQANQIEANLRDVAVDRYGIYRVQRDVIEYHNMCSLETALAQIRASLRATAPDAGRSPPAAQGGQTGGGAPDTVPPRRPDLAADPDGVGAAASVPPRPPPPRIARRAGPAVLSNEPEAQISNAEFASLRSAFGLSPTRATQPNSPAFKASVAAFQRCKHAPPTGRLTDPQKASLLAGGDACLTQPGGT